ncbi:MAG: glycine betaine ABC transporter substrate-binding protein [Anaerovoracaceae bacterium]|jgi:glycine betaine/proline transport system substrate-binding protein
MFFKRKKKWKKVLIFTLALALSLTIVGCGGNEADGGNGEGTGDAGKRTIRIGMVNWAECIANSNLWKVILEDQGYKVELTPLDAAPLYVGLSKGDFDLFLDAWLPITHEAYWNEYQNNLDDYGIWFDDAKIGIVVPQYVTIDTIEELKGDKDQFDGKIIGIDPGAGLMKASNVANEAYGLEYQIVQGSEAAMMAAMEKAYQNEEWIAITGWSPHWMFSRYDLKYLEDPKLSYGEAEQLHVLANKDFSAEFPEIQEMLSKFKMDDAQIGSLEELILDSTNPEEAARQWIEENQDLVNSWIQ